MALFGLYDPLGLHWCLKAQLIAAFIRDIFVFIRSAIFGYIIFLTIAFLDIFLYPSRGILAFHCSCPFSHMLRNIVSAFSFSIGAYITFPIQVVHELSVLANNISSDQREFCTVPNIGTTQLTKSKFCHQLKAETQYKQGGLSNKGCSEERSPVPQVK